MNQIIKPESVDFNELVSNNTIKISVDCQSKMIDILNTEFTEGQARWYIANLFMFINYHPTNEFPINLQILVELAGFSHKRNAKRTLENNFVLDRDYKIVLLPKEGNSKSVVGRPEERIMLNTDTFKSMCMLVKTDKSKDIRLYYVKLENIYNKIVMEEMETNKRLLKEKELIIEQTKNQSQLLQLNLQESDNKITLMTRKTNKFVEGDSVYIFHSTIMENGILINLYKPGRTKNANVRDSIHKTASYKGILLQITCVDSVLLERIIHFLLDKYRRVNRREWFECSFDIIKNAIDYAKYVFESDINFENFDLDKVKIPIKNKIVVQEIQNVVEIARPLITHLDRIYPDINDFDLFIGEHFDFDKSKFVSHITLKNQYKIWSKTANNTQLKNLIEHLKLKYISFMYKSNHLVSTSKLTLHFRGITLKQSLFIFDDPSNKQLIIENYLYENCQRAPGFRITMQDTFSDFEVWIKSLDIDITITELIKNKIKAYLDVRFIRLRTGDESNGKDNRLGGWLGFALKTNLIPEPIKNYKPKNKNLRSSMHFC